MTRIALITGGNRGIGRATAETYARDGVDSIITYRSNREEADAVVASVTALGRAARALHLDTTDPASFPAFIEQVQAVLAEGWGRDDLDIIVSSAGFDAETPFGTTTGDQIDALYNVHVRGPILLLEALASNIADGGRIVLVSTGLTRYVANPAYSVYAAMKGAIEVYAKYAAKVLGGRRITVNTIAPGATATDFAGGRIRDDENYRAMILRNHAAGRLGEPDDVAQAISAITAEHAGWITAQRIEASGGQSL